METIQFDAFHPATFVKHVPTDVIAKNQKVRDNVLVVMAAVAIAVVLISIYTKHLEERSKNVDSTK